MVGTHVVTGSFRIPWPKTWTTRTNNLLILPLRNKFQGALSGTGKKQAQPRNISSEGSTSMKYYWGRFHELSQIGSMAAHPRYPNTALSGGIWSILDVYRVIITTWTSKTLHAETHIYCSSKRRYSIHQLQHPPSSRSQNSSSNRALKKNRFHSKLPRLLDIWRLKRLFSTGKVLKQNGSQEVHSYQASCKRTTTVDGRNPAPVDRQFIP